MLRTTTKSNLKQSLKAILAVAALGLTAGAANAQYGAYNTSNSFGLTRLGGPVVVADYSGYGAYGGGYGGYNSFNNGFYGSAGAYGNYGAYTTPQNIAFNGNGNVGVGSNGVAGGNQLITDPLLGFQQPRTIIDPTTGQVVSVSNAAANASATFNAQLAQFNANRAALVNTVATGNSALIQQNGVAGNLGLVTNNGLAVNTANAGLTNSAVVTTNTGVTTEANMAAAIAPFGTTVNGSATGTMAGTGRVPYWTAVNPMLDASNYANQLVYPTATGSTMNSAATGNVPYWTSVNPRLDSMGQTRSSINGSSGYTGYTGYNYRTYNGTTVNGAYSIPSSGVMGNPGLRYSPVIGGPPHITSGRAR